MRIRGRLPVLLGLAAILATGCAQPGQLGSPVLATAPTPPPSAAATAQPPPSPAAPPTTAPPAGPVLIGSGRVESRVSLRTAGPAVLSVRTLVLPPGGTTGWHRRPGTEMSIVRSGRITVLRKGDCDPTRYDAGDGVFIPDAEPHLARNDGPLPAELVVTSLLAPGAPERSDVSPAC